MLWGTFVKDEWYYKWGFENELQQIYPPSLSISDVHASNEYISTNRISMYFYNIENKANKYLWHEGHLLGLYLNATLMLRVNSNEPKWTNVN